MLKFSRKTEYALIALRHMQGRDSQTLTSAKEIAAAYAIPAELLAKTLQQLARAEIIEPVQGPHGGYRLKTSLDQIRLSDFIEILEGPVGLADCFKDAHCNQLETCTIRTPVQRINNSMRSFFGKVSIAELMG